MVVLFVAFLSANYRLDARGGWVHPALPEDRAVWSKHAALLWTVCMCPPKIHLPMT